MNNRKTIPFTDEDVNELLELLDGGPYGELNLETERFKLHLSRNGEGNWCRETLNKDVVESAISAETSAQLSEQEDQIIDGLVNVPAPMGGVFYRAPKPGAAPFVQVGSRVEEDTVVAIIEVMKLMNTARAGVRGEVVEILGEDGQFIEQGRAMIRVKPDR